MSDRLSTSPFIVVHETLHDAIPALVHPQWAEEFPWLVQGTTTRGSGGFDLGLFSGGSPESAVRRNWARLLGATGVDAAAHARQVHGSMVRIHEDAGDVAAVPNIVGDADGHATSRAGLLLSVTVADCVPVFVLDPTRRVVAVLHSGWRGAAHGILEKGLSVMAEAWGSRGEDLRVHLGPSICGRCYEVGPEVFEALGRAAPPTPTPIDLRAILAERALAVGVDPSALSVSGHCTRCTSSDLYSHRGGDAGRQVGYVAVRRS